MKLNIYQIDAFSKDIFSGNPAAVVPLLYWLDDEMLQKIAQENNLSETAFYVAANNSFELRWFTPIAEVALCGHATLASAYVLFELLGYKNERIDFFTKSGKLSVSKEKDNMLAMDFPAEYIKPCIAPSILMQALGIKHAKTFIGTDYTVILETEEQVTNLRPDLAKLLELDARGVIITARGNSVDFVSRIFAPKIGINEDPVTGSAHCATAPYWSKKLGKTKLAARQLSSRGGDVLCEVVSDRVILKGYCAKYLVGEIEIN